MVSVSPSPALLNARLMSKKVELEHKLREQAKENRELRQQCAGHVDHILGLEDANKELAAHLKRILGRRGNLTAALPEGQGLLFATAIEGMLAPEAEELPKLDAEDAQVPDAEEPATKAPKKTRDRTGRKIDESNLLVEVQRLELAPEDRRCPTTGVELVEVGVTITKELHYRSAKLVRIESHRVVYGPPPEVAKERNIAPLLGPAPSIAVEGVTASPALLAWLLCQKYVLHLPLYRQEDAFARLGVRISRKTLCDWVLKCAFALKPVASAIEGQIRAGPVLQLDDTRIKVKRAGEGGGKLKVKQSYLWVFVNPEVSGVAFRFTKGRSTEDLASLLRLPNKTDPIDVLVGDGYAANRSGAREAGMDVRHAGCWAHLLRKFRDALKEAPHAMGLYMKDIGAIYEIETRGREAKLDSEALLELRRKEAMPIVIDMMRQTSNWKDKYSLEGSVANAMTYARNQRRTLLEFLRDGRVPIDNNACERAIRPVAIGRKNWLFAGSVEGAHAAAVIYTIVESAKASGVDPLGYIQAALERLGELPESRVDELLPWRMTAELEPYRERGVS